MSAILFMAGSFLGFAAGLVIGILVGRDGV